MGRRYTRWEVRLQFPDLRTHLSSPDWEVRSPIPDSGADAGADLPRLCPFQSGADLGRYDADLPRSVPDGDGHDLGRSGQIIFRSRSVRDRSCPDIGILVRIWVRSVQILADLGTDLG
eukprot:gene13560-biopygen21576